MFWYNSLEGPKPKGHGPQAVHEFDYNFFLIWINHPYLKIKIFTGNWGIRLLLKHERVW